MTLPPQQTTLSPASPASPTRTRGPAARVLGNAWHAVTGALGAIAGLLPHLLHHVSLLGGAVLVSGASGNLLFGVLGLLLSVPLLSRLYRRYRSWLAPGIALAVFTGMFALSALVIGPALRPTPEPSSPVSPTQIDHASHHGG